MYNQLGKGRKSYSLVQFPRIQLKNGLKKSVKDLQQSLFKQQLFQIFSRKNILAKMLMFLL